MKKLLLSMMLCIATTALYAETINIQTSGMTKVVNDQKNSYSGDYSFSINTDRDLFVITNLRSDTQSGFANAGTYKIKHAETVRDNTVGTAYAFLITKDNVDYVVTITKQLISFSRSGQTNQLCWHFTIKQ